MTNRVTIIEEMPDPRDCTPNAPAVLLENDDVISICKNSKVYYTPDQEASSQVRFEAERNYILNRARSLGWSDVTLLGRQVLLVANVQVVDNIKSPLPASES